MKTIILALLLFAGTASIAYSGEQKVCYFNGKAYPIGTVIGPYVCTESGWQPR